MAKPDNVWCKTCVFKQGTHCRVSPPQVIPVAELRGAQAIQGSTVWPVVADDHFCGEWAGEWPEDEIEDEDGDPGNTIPGFPPVP